MKLLLEMQHDFADRAKLAPYLNRVLTWNGIVYHRHDSLSGQTASHRHKPSLIVVSLQADDYPDLRLDHCVVAFHQADLRNIDRYQPIKFDAIVYRYHQPILNHGLSYLKETYGLSAKSKPIRLPELKDSHPSIWLTKRCRQYQFNLNNYLKLPNNGSREHAINRDIHRYYQLQSSK